MNTNSFKERQKLFQRVAEQNSSKFKDIFSVNKAKTKKNLNNDLTNSVIDSSSIKLDKEEDNKSISAIKKKKSSDNLIKNINKEQNIKNDIVKNMTMKKSIDKIKKEMEEAMIKKEKEKEK